MSTERTFTREDIGNAALDFCLYSGFFPSSQELLDKHKQWFNEKYPEDAPMPLAAKKIEYHDWFDIRDLICQKMGITKDHFRDYHKVIGGEYKDLWHEWLEYFDSQVRNDTTVSNDLGEHMESKIGWVTEDGKEWLVPFVEAVYAVWDENNITHVHYSW